MVFSTLLFLCALGCAFQTKENDRLSAVPENHLEVINEADVSRYADITFVTTKYPVNKMPITYHKGKVLSAPNLYVIFYGNGSWTTTNANDYVKFLTNFGGSNYMKYAQNLYKTGIPVLKKASLVNGGSTTAELSSKANILNFFKNQLANGNFGSATPDPQGIYIVVTDIFKSKNLKRDSSTLYNTHFCGYHDVATSAASVKFPVAIIGTTGSGACGWKMSSGMQSMPSKDPYKDYVFSVLAHEIIEAINDPFLDAWYDDSSSKYESEDKCNGFPGAANFVQGTSGPIYNAGISGTYYLLQTQYNNSTRTCENVIW